MINKLVDVTSNHEVLSFMDAYSGYKHIKMEKGYAFHITSNSNNGIHSNIIMSLWVYYRWHHVKDNGQ